MYKIQQIFKNISLDAYNVSNLKYGDTVYIFTNKSIYFKDLIKITLDEIFDVNNDGIIVSGFQYFFDDDGCKQKKEFKGIFVYKLEDGVILTNEGYKLPVLTEDDYELLDYDYILNKRSVEWAFNIDVFSVVLNVSGDVYFDSDEVEQYLENIRFESCKAFSNKIVLKINGFDIIYEDAKIKYKNKEISYEMFFNYLCENCKSDNNAIYSVNRIFTLQPDRFIILTIEN